MRSYTYQSVRTGDRVRKEYLGPNSDPSVQLFLRQKRLDMANSIEYERQAASEQMQHKSLELIGRAAKDALARRYLAELQPPGYTLTQKQELTRMTDSIPPMSELPTPHIDDTPGLSEEALQELLARVRNNDQDALLELEAIVSNKSHPLSIDLNFFAIAKEEFDRLVGRSSPVVKAFVADTTERLLGSFVAEENTAMGRMLAEHMQFFVLVSQYNGILNLSAAASSREKAGLLNRAKAANRQLLDIWKMYREYNVLVSSNWTKMPSELPTTNLSKIQELFLV